MKKLIFLLIIILLQITMLGESYALFIGVSDYANSGISKLKYTIKDVERLEQVFLNNRMVEKTNLTRLVNPTRSEMLIALKRISKLLTREDTLYFYFSGHGIELNNNFYFLTKDSEPEFLEETSIEGKEVQALFNTKAQRIIMMIDACHSGAVGENKAVKINTDLFSDNIKTIISGTGRVMISSSGKNEESREDTKSELGLFTKNLADELESLKSSASVEEIMQKVISKVVKESSGSQTPQITGNGKDILIVKIEDETLVINILEKIKNDWDSGKLSDDLYKEAKNVLLKIKDNKIPEKSEVKLFDLLKDYYNKKFTIEMYPALRKTIGEEKIIKEEPVQIVKGTNILKLKPINDLIKGNLVFFDGIESGKIEDVFIIQNVVTGKHKLEIKGSLIKDIIREINITGEYQTITEELKGEYAQRIVMINSTPSNSKIYINGQEVNETTPYQTGLDIGKSYEIAVKKEMYLTMIKNINIDSKGEVIQLNFTLQQNKPPEAVNIVYPLDNQENIELMPVLKWICIDDDNSPLKYDVYFGTNKNPPLVLSDITNNSYRIILNLKNSTVYYWKIVARDIYNRQAESIVSSFTTLNNPPVPGDIIYPKNGETGVLTWPILKWNRFTDPEGDEIVYDVYLDTEKEPKKKIGENIKLNMFPVENLRSITKYYWYIQARDSKGGTAKSSVYEFTTANTLPDKIKLNYPVDGTKNLPLEFTLKWEQSKDPDEDKVFYDIYIWKSENQKEKRAEKLKDTFYTISKLESGTVYYLKINAVDSKGGVKEGDIITFTTMNRHPVDFKLRTPSDNSLALPLKLFLKWEKSDDPDGDKIVYEVICSIKSDIAFRKETTETYIETEQLKSSVKYEWYVIAKDGKGGKKESQHFYFTTGNTPPEKPQLLTPVMEIMAETDTLFKWKCSDPDGDKLIYDLYLGKSPDKMKLESKNLENNYITLKLDKGHIVYYWKVIAKDGNNGEIESVTATFTTKNNPPEDFKILYPSGNEKDKIPFMVHLQWKVPVDKDNDTFTYQVYLLDMNELNKIGNSALINSYLKMFKEESLNGVEEMTKNSTFIKKLSPKYDVEILKDNVADILCDEVNAETKYYWKVFASDGYGGISKSDAGSFETHKMSMPEMINVEGTGGFLFLKGNFMMGDTFAATTNEPVHPVELTYDFMISKYEITIDYYYDFCRKTNLVPEYYIKKSSSAIYNEYQNYQVSNAVITDWYSAILFCNWLSRINGLSPAYNESGRLLDEKGNVTEDITKVAGYRLPTEAEWEYAAKGGKKSKGYVYSGSSDLNEVLSDHFWLLKTGTKNPNELGIYDMTGNAEEWCYDNWYEYTTQIKTNPVNIPESKVLKDNPPKDYPYYYYKVIRGLNWTYKISSRSLAKADEFYGFRVVKTIIK